MERQLVRPHGGGDLTGPFHTGYADGTFGPSNAVSRQAMAAFLFRFAALGLAPAN